MRYAEELAAWAVRAEAAGYFADVFDPQTEVEVNGSELHLRTLRAIEQWAAPPEAGRLMMATRGRRRAA